jgi:hypothetical protein
VSYAASSSLDQVSRHRLGCSVWGGDRHAQRILQRAAF